MTHDKIANNATYKVTLTKQPVIVPSSYLIEAIIPDSTPGMITRYAISDKPLLLAKIRHNRLIDFLTGLIICYSLQTHLRTIIPGAGQIETDEVNVGIDRRGTHYILTVQAAGIKEKVRSAHIEQNIAVCAAKFPKLIAHNLAAQLLADNRIALFELVQIKEGIRISAEKHYKLVPSEDLSSHPRVMCEKK